MSAEDAIHPADDLSGQQLGDFQLQQLLGRGGMGEVYLAEQLSLHRPVALKILQKKLASDASYLRRFKAEAMSVARINHPNIVSVYTIGEDKGYQFIALEYVPGKNLRDYIHRKGGLEPALGLMILKKIAAALQCAHEAGIIHRDVKPENVLLTRKGDVKVTDFGLARNLENENLRLTQSGLTMGTPLYMSPEQIHGLPADARSDLYSLGITAYHLFAGEPPYTGPTMMAVAMRHVAGNAQPLGELRRDLPGELTRIIHQLMKPKAEDRIASAAELFKELQRVRLDVLEPLEGTLAISANPERVADPEPVPPLRQSLTVTASRLAKSLHEPKHRTWLWTLAFLLTLAVGSATAWWQREPSLLHWRNRDAARKLELPDVSDVQSFPDSSRQLAHAMEAAGDERETRLWKVLLSDLDDEEDTLQAGMLLLKKYLDTRSYDRGMQVAQRVIDLATEAKKEDHPDSKRKAEELGSCGCMFRGIVESRLGRAEDSMSDFRAAIAAGAANADQTSQRKLLRLRWMYREFVKAKTANEVVLDTAEHRKMNHDLNRLFYQRFLPSMPFK